MLIHGIPAVEHTQTAQAPWTQSAIGIAQIIVNALLAFVLWRLNYHIFSHTSEQKIAERNAAWFHKVLVDPNIAELQTFFSNAALKLSDAAAECDRAKSSGQMNEFDRIATDAIQAFTHQLLLRRRALVDAAAAFPSRLADELSEIFFSLQDQTSQWFDSFRRLKPEEAHSSLPELLTTRHTEILVALRNYEFREWGLKKEEGFFVRLWGRFRKKNPQASQP